VKGRRSSVYTQLNRGGSNTEGGGRKVGKGRLGFLSERSSLGENLGVGSQVPILFRGSEGLKEESIALQKKGEVVESRENSTKTLRGATRERRRKGIKQEKQERTLDIGVSLVRKGKPRRREEAAILKLNVSLERRDENKKDSDSQSPSFHYQSAVNMSE